MHFNYLVSHALTYVVMTSSMFPLHLDMSTPQAPIHQLMQDSFTFEEFLVLIEDLENGIDLEDKYDLEITRDFLTCMTLLGASISDEEDSSLEESLQELYKNIDDDDLAQIDLPSWYHRVYFPHQLTPLSIQSCSFHISKPIKKATHAVKKGAKETFKFTKSSLKKAAKGIARPFKKGSKKGWKQTKKFIKEHKKAIIIGLIVAITVTVAVTVGPEVSALMASCLPLGGRKHDKVNEELYETYTEDDFTNDCIEIVQQELSSRGIDKLAADDITTLTSYEMIKGIASKISHDLIEGIESTVHTLAFISSEAKKLKQLGPNLSDTYQVEQTYLDQSVEAAFHAIAYLHQKTDEVFDTSLADSYSCDLHESKIKKFHAVIPPPGSLLNGKLCPKELIKKFTKNNYRKNLMKSEPLASYAEVEAHHVFPQAKRLQDKFNEYGINVHDPQYLVWWKKNAHRANSASYSKKWEEFFRDTPNITKEKILEKGKQLMVEYGIETLY